MSSRTHTAAKGFLKNYGVHSLGLFLDATWLTLAVASADAFVTKIFLEYDGMLTKRGTAPPHVGWQGVPFTDRRR